MRRLVILPFLVLLSGGCSSEETGQDVTPVTEPDETATIPGQTARETAPSVTPVPGSAETAAIPGPTALSPGEIAVTGSVGCGSCTYQVVSECTAAFRTTDGVVYLLEDVQAGSELFAKRLSDKPIRVVGVPREEEGIRYLAVKSFEI